MLHIVDDETEIQSAIRWMVKSYKLECASYLSGEQFLEALDIPIHKGASSHAKKTPPFKFDPNGDCVLLDVRMPGISGVTTFDILSSKKLIRRMPVIFMTGHGDISMAVDAIKRGAFDFFEKPFEDYLLFGRVQEALCASRKETEASMVQNRLDKLTCREKEILGLIMVGKMNKVIADKLGISMRTVEVHRANILEKMQVRSAIELAGMIK